MKELRNVIVLGARGEVGSHIVQALQSASFNVSAAIRPSSGGMLPAHLTSVSIHYIDYDDLSCLVSAFLGQDVVISALSTFSTSIQKKAIDAAVVAKVKQFIPTEYGYDTSRIDALKVLPFAKGRQDIVDYLKSKESDGLSWTAIHTGNFWNWFLEIDGQMGFNIPDLRVTIYDSGDQPFEIITHMQLRRVIVSTLLNPTKTENARVYCSSFTLTQNKVISTIECLLGRKLSIDRDTTQNAIEEVWRCYDKQELDESLVHAISAGAYSPYGLDHFGRLAREWMEALNIPADEDFETAVRKLLIDKKLLQVD